MKLVKILMMLLSVFLQPRIGIVIKNSLESWLSIPYDVIFCWWEENIDDEADKGPTTGWEQEQM